MNDTQVHEKLNNCNNISSRLSINIVSFWLNCLFLPMAGCDNQPKNPFSTHPCFQKFAIGS